jgi:hypothetical protein
MLIAPKEIILDSFMRMAETGLLDKDYLLVKLQGLVLEGDLAQEEIQPIVNILVPPEA